MIWPFNDWTKAREKREREILRDIKVLESQHALLNAATETADAANVVTHTLKQRLEDAVHQFQSTARILNDALIICDATGAIQAFNPAAERLFGLSADDVRSTPIGDLILSDWLNLTENDEGVGKHSSGEFLRLDINHTRLERSDGSLIDLFVLRQRMTELENYKSVFETSFDGILVVKNRMIVAANSSIGKLFGYEIDDLLSKNVDILIAEKDRMLLGDHIVNSKLQGTHHDGGNLNVYFAATPIKWDSEPASLITIKKIAESRMTAPSSRLICGFGEDFKITFANAAFAKHYNVQKTDLPGMDIRTLLPDNECDPFLIHISSLTPEEPSRRMQLQTNAADGTSRLHEWTDYATFDEDGVEYQRIGKDISKRFNTKDNF